MISAHVSDHMEAIIYIAANMRDHMQVIISISANVRDHMQDIISMDFDQVALCYQYQCLPVGVSSSALCRSLSSQ